MGIGMTAIAPKREGSEAAELPPGWMVKTLGEIATVSAGGTPSRSVAAYWGGGIPWITTSQIDFARISEGQQFITKLGLEHSAAKMLPPGCLLMALYGQGKTRGKVAILEIEAATNQACAAIAAGPDVSSDYLFHYLTSRYEAIRGMSNAGNQDNLNGAIVKSIEVVLPPLPQQRAIASALNDADRFLEALHRLIEKKRGVRQGVGQRLLTGENRLPGFSGVWRPAQIGSLGETYGGLSGKTAEDFGHGDARYVPFLNVLENVRLDPSDYEQVVVRRREKQSEIRVGDLLFNGTSETPGDLAMASVVVETTPRTFLNSFCFGFRLNRPDEHDALFLAYAFRGPVGRRLLYALAQGATRYNLSKAQFKRLELSLPDVDEQRAIARVLTDLDAEIAALVAHRDKIKAMKKGIAQGLLTGRCPLVEPAVPA